MSALRFVFLLLWAAPQAAWATVGAVCSSPTAGSDQCLNGHISLLGEHLQLGVHRCSSFGVPAAPPGAIKPGAPLGMLSDFDQNGFDTYSFCEDDWYIDGWEICPKFAGDFILPGDPIEGTTLQWKSSGGASNSHYMFGLMTPCPTVVVPQFQPSSSPGSVSSLWRGVVGGVEMLVVTALGERDLHTTTYVKLRNTGASVITDLYYGRIVDPDNEEEQYWSRHATRNYVKYQPVAQAKDFAMAGNRYLDSSNPHSAFVVARGRNREDFYMGLGAVNPNARVTHTGRFFNPSTAFADTKWLGFGGHDTSNTDVSRMDLEDDNLNLLFKYDAVAPGNVVQAQFVYVLAEHREDQVLRGLSLLEVVQPAYFMTGPRALLSIRCARPMASLEVTVFGVQSRLSPLAAWYPVDVSTGCQAGAHVSAVVNASLFSEGAVQFKVVGLPADSDDERAETHSAAVVCNTDPTIRLEITQPTGANCATSTEKRFYTGLATTIVLSSSQFASKPPKSVSFFRDVYSDGRVQSMLVGSSTSGPFSAVLSVADLPAGAVVFLRSQVNFGTTGCVPTATLSGVVVRENQAPSDVLLSISRVAENTAAGSRIGDLALVDADPGPVVRYSLLDDAGGAFAIVNHSLVVRGAIDFETTPVLTCRIRADDGGNENCCFEKTFEITVEDVNEAPSSVAPLEVTVFENIPAGSVVAVLEAQDPDVGQTASFALLGSSPAFSLDPVSGELRTAAVLDHETRHVYELTLRVADSGAPSMYLDSVVVVTVVGVNEAPTDLVLSCVAAACVVEENSPEGSVVGTFAAWDEDADDMMSYALVGSVGGVFAVNASSGELFVSGQVDYELLGAEVTVTARVTDSGGLSVTASFPLRIINVAEPPYALDIVCYVNEGRPVGETVTAVAGGSSPCAMGVLLNEGSVVDFEVLSGASNRASSDPVIFVQSCSGALFVSGMLDFEANNHYNISVAIRDEGGEFVAQAHVYVVDVNEPPVLLPLEDMRVQEDAPVGSAVGRPMLFSVLDEDCEGGPGRLHCGPLHFTVAGGSGAWLFNFSDASTGQLQVAASGLNFEVMSEYSLVVRVADAGGLYSEELVWVNVTDVNEPPRLTYSTGAFATVPEHTASGVPIGFPIFASDDDEGQSVAVSIVDGNHFDTFALVAVPEARGASFLFVVANSSSLDYESSPLFALVLVAADDGVPSRTVRQTYLITLSDVNEPPSLVSSLAFSVPEHSAAGTVVGTPLKDHWADPDIGDTAVFSISSYGNDVVRLFVVDATTGVVTLRSAQLNYAYLSFFTYEVRVTDKGGLTAYSQLTINVSDVKEAPVFAEILLVEIAENVPGSRNETLSRSAQTFYFRAIDGDNDPLVFSVVAVDDSSERAYLFRAEATTDARNAAVVVSTTTLNYEVQPSYGLTLSVTDGYFTTIANVSVIVLDINDPPTLPPSVTCCVAVDTAIGVEVCSIIGTDEDSLEGAENWGRLKYSFHSPLPGFEISTTENIGVIGYSGLAALNTTIGTIATVTVIATDGGGLSAHTVVTFVALPAAPRPQCPAQNMIFSVTENAISGTFVGTVLGSNSSISSANGSLSVSIVGGNAAGSFTLNSSSGVLSVTPGADINYEGVRTFDLIIFAAELSLQPLSVTCHALIEVLDVNEPTVFYDQQIQADENISPGPLTVKGVPASRVSVVDEDPGDQHGLFSLQCIRCADDPIDINATSGQLFLKLDHYLDFESFDRYEYDCFWLSRGVEAHARVTVSVLDIAEAPLVQAMRFVVNETDSWISVGSVIAKDPDFAASLGVGASCFDRCGLIYRIVGGSPRIGQFTLDESTGALSVGSLDFEGVSEYELVVRVIDESGLTNTGVVSVAILDVPDCGITSILNDLGDVIRSALTAGGEHIFVHGINLGPTSQHAGAVTVISASLQNGATTEESSYYYQLPCHLNHTGWNDNTLLSCVIPPGVGAALGVVVSVSVQYPGLNTSCRSALSVGRMSYAPPMIDSIQSRGTFATNGSSYVEISGYNFGPAMNSFVQATYFNEHIARTVICEIVEDHVSLRCPCSPGVGGLLSWVVSIGNQQSNSVLYGSYSSPVVEAVSTTFLDTIGGDLFDIYGDNFGAHGSAVEVWYGSESEWEHKASSCSFIIPHLHMSCRATAGVGSDLKVVVMVGGLTSHVFHNVGLSYRSPIVTAVTGPGAESANTAGGDVVYVKGRYFGPVGLDPDHLVVRYGVSSSARLFTALSCYVVTSDVLIQCTTSPGTGTDLAWHVAVAGQHAPVFAGNTSYSPPVITTYAGEGARDANTAGNDTVSIIGRNFGATIDTLEKVSYRAVNKTSFIVTRSCVMVEPHVHIRCTTVPGAGAFLTWYVVVDGQQSVSPTTSYGRPVVSEVSGRTVSNASVLGGELLVISGFNFGPADALSLYGEGFLDSVRYGVSGSEYQASMCTVLSNQAITCRTARGVGRRLFFTVTVAGQSSLRSSAEFSYAPPSIDVASPVVVSTDGTTRVVVRGQNFAVFSMPTVFFSGNALIATYLSESELEFSVPEAAVVGSAFCDLYLDVGGQASNTVQLQYLPPMIRTLSTLDGGNGTLRLVIEGESFSLAPEVLLYDSVAEVMSSLACGPSTHREIVCDSIAKKGNITVLVGNQYSNVKTFSYGSPTVLSAHLSAGANAATTGWTVDNPAALIVIGQNFGEDSSNVVVFIESTSGSIAYCRVKSFFVITKHDSLSQWTSIAGQVGNVDAARPFEQISCELPPGEGRNNSIKVRRGSVTSTGCSCLGCSAEVCFSYLPPVVTSIDPSGGPTSGGYLVVLRGENFGFSSTVHVGGEEWTVHKNGTSHTELTVIVPPGEGHNLPVTVVTAGQVSTGGVFYSYEAPAFAALAVKILVSTSGSDSDVTLFGSNFGVRGPILSVDGNQVVVTSFDHESVVFTVPPGQKVSALIAINVSGQVAYSMDAIGYAPPNISGVFPLNGDSEGGRVTNTTVAVYGSNFGSACKSWTLSIGTIAVNRSDVVHFTDSSIVFYPPEGVGADLPVHLEIGGQSNIGEVFRFSFNPPVIETLVQPSSLDTRGGDLLTFRGKSLGRSGALIFIEDSQYSVGSTQYRMPPTPCVVTAQSHTELTCRTPPGAGTNLKITVFLGGDVVDSVYYVSYAKPVISHFYLARGGDAAGGEILKVFGSNFGVFRTPVNISVSGTPCLNAVWLADDPLQNYRPYLQCRTSKMTVGVKNVSLSVAFQTSGRPASFKATCKTGHFGRVGEYCTNCGVAASTGLVCDKDDMLEPFAHTGFFIQLMAVPSTSCSLETQSLRTMCPASLACLPAKACSGNNTCADAYDGVRCGNCADGYYKINGECQACPDVPWLIPTALLALAALIIVIVFILQRRKANLTVLSISVDFFQVLAVFATAKVAWPSSLVWIFNAASTLNMNIDVVAAECYNNAAIPYRERWYVVAASPVVVVLLGGVVFAFCAAFFRRRNLSSLFLRFTGGYIVLFNYCYLMLSKNSLAVFNCQSPEPSDGHQYMADVGPDGGLCYTEGTMQQELEPWAVLTAVVYGVGFPLIIGTCLRRYRQTAASDQLMKAARRKCRDTTDRGVTVFRLLFRRVYSDFKPDKYYWSLVILAKKFVLSVSAVVFRENTVFLLAVYLLILFVSYYGQVKFSPYMPVSEYESVLGRESEIDEADQEEIIKADSKGYTKKMRKRAMLGREGPMFANLGRPMEFFTDYNTVESYLLLSTILLAISGLMFESGQLSEMQRAWLAVITAFIIIASVLYLTYVLTVEIWVAVFLNSWLCCYLKDKSTLSNSTDKQQHFEDVDLEYLHSESHPDSLNVTKSKLLNLEMQLESSMQLIDKQKQEISRLKRNECAGRNAKEILSSTKAPPAQPRLKKRVASSVFEQVNPMNSGVNGK